MDGKDGYGLKLEKVWPTVSSLHNCKCHAYKNHQKNTLGLCSQMEFTLKIPHNYTGGFCVWVKPLSSEFSTELT